MLNTEQAQQKVAPIRAQVISENTENTDASELSWAMEFVRDGVYVRVFVFIGVLR